MPVGWELSEGGGLLDDADVEIVKAYFGYDAAYNEGESLVLFLEGKTDASDDGEFRQFYSMGAGWETPDRGKTCSHDKRDTLTKTSNYGLLIGAAFEAGAEEIIKGRGTPDVAAIWEGLSFHMERQEVERKGLGTSEVLLPTAFLGEADDKPKAKDKPKGKSTAGKALAAKLKVLAKKSDSHEDFVEAVLDTYPEVEDDADLFADVLDDEDGIWAKVQ